MDTADQVVFVLQLILVVGPLAVYFLGLGLVNSQAHPCLVNARADFVLLTVAFLPVLIGPILFLIQHDCFWLAAAVLAAIVALFRLLLPSRHSAWVIYNVSSEQCSRLLERACRRLGWALAPTGDRWVISPAELTVTVSGLPWLRNVTIRIHTGSLAADAQRHRLIAALEAEIQREAMLPSPMGASLVLIGASLLGVPMWYLFHHMDAIVDVVRHILFA